MSRVKIVVYTPEAHADAIRQALGEAGAGKIGNYDFCSFSVKGTGRFRPNEQANPTIGHSGKLAEVYEDRIEVVCDREILEHVLTAIKKVHPYEEPATDIYPLEG